METGGKEELKPHSNRASSPLLVICFIQASVLTSAVCLFCPFLPGRTHTHTKTAVNYAGSSTFHRYTPTIFHPPPPAPSLSLTPSNPAKPVRSSTVRGGSSLFRTPNNGAAHCCAHTEDFLRRGQKTNLPHCRQVRSSAGCSMLVVVFLICVYV